MKKNVAKKILAGALCSAMIFGTAACGNDAGQNNSTAQNSSNSGSASNSGAASNEGSAAQNSGESSGGESNTQAPLKVTISLPSDKEHVEADSTYDKLVAELNEYLNADITWQWKASDSYYNQLGLRYAAGDVADIMVVGNDAAFLSAAIGGAYEVTIYEVDENGEPIMIQDVDKDGNPKTDKDGNPVMIQQTHKEQREVTDGLFWDLTDYLQDYDNLAVIPEAALAGVSYNGTVYSLPRSRNLARNGWGYRQDWLNNLGLKEPTTWDEFTDMLYKFTYNDPDQNGQNDTVGLFLDSWSGVWDIMMLWFGVPNQWGIDENGDLIHRSQTEEYKTALAAFRQLYSDGVINNGVNNIQDYRDTTAGKARDEGLRTGLGGVYIQVLDDARKIETYFEDNSMYGLDPDNRPMDPDDLVFRLAGYITTESGGNQPYVMPSGSATQAIAISKTGNIKTEEDLKRALQLLNDLNNGDCLNLIEYGWENETYEINEEGYVELWMGSDDESKAKLDAAGVSGTTYRNGFNQIPTYYTAEENARPITTAPAGTAITILENHLYEVDQQYCVTNYGAAYTSDFYKDNAASLDPILTDSMNQYITGEIDDAGLEAAIEQWWTAGGETVTREMNELYHAAGN